jgi:hypothetical protein
MMNCETVERDLSGEEQLRRVLDGARDGLAEEERAAIRDEREALLGGYVGGAA